MGRPWRPRPGCWAAELYSVVLNICATVTHCVLHVGLRPRTTHHTTKHYWEPPEATSNCARLVTHCIGLRRPQNALQKQIGSHFQLLPQNILRPGEVNEVTGLAQPKSPEVGFCPRNALLNDREHSGTNHCKSDPPVGHDPQFETHSYPGRLEFASEIKPRWEA